MASLQTGPRAMLSVAMCTCDGAAYLPEQLDSIVAQTRRPDEVVISDDASTDGTLDLLESFRRGAPFPVVVERTERRRGTVRNFEHALGATRGEVVVLADQDDVWVPDKLACLEQVLRQHPDAGLCFSDADVVDDMLRPLNRGLWESVGLDAEHLREIGAGRALPALLHRTRVTGATLAVRRHVLELASPFPDLAACDVLHDGWLALMAACVGEVVPVPRRLVAYRQHPHQQIGARTTPGASRATGEHWDVHGQARLAAELARRLEQRPDVAVGAARRSAASARLLQSRRHHLEVRLAARSTGRAGRVRPVIAELLRGGYRDHASGVRSAAKDLLVP